MKLYQDIFFGTGAMTVELIDAFLNYRKSIREKELETPEWKALEAAYNDHLKWRFKYPARVFGQQLAATWLITLLVIALVISGVTFSFIQLQTAIKLGDFSSLHTELAVETAGTVSISSSVIGALVLVISLAFFYLYLKHVFTIQHPVPPHVGFADTDAHSLHSRNNEKLPDELLAELERLRTRYNFHGAWPTVCTASPSAQEQTKADSKSDQK